MAKNKSKSVKKNWYAAETGRTSVKNQAPVRWVTLLRNLYICYYGHVKAGTRLELLPEDAAIAIKYKLAVPSAQIKA